MSDSVPNPLSMNNVSMETPPFCAWMTSASASARASETKKVFAAGECGWSVARFGAPVEHFDGQARFGAARPRVFAEAQLIDAANGCL